MSLVDQILSAIDNPNQQASTGQIASILNTVQQLSNSYNTNPSTMESALSIVGNYVRSALQQKRAEVGYEGTQRVINRYSGTYPNPQAVDALFGSSQIQQMVQAVTQRTGLDANMILEMLPILVPVVLNLLRTGSNTQNPQAGNPVLNSFLDSDRDGDVDIADAMRLAGRFLSR